MKRILLICLTFLIFLTPVVYASDISVIIDNEEISFDVEPILENGRVMIPVRAVFESLGADVTWDNDTATATAQKDDIKVDITVGSDVLYVNGEERAMDVPAKEVDGRVLIPVRFAAEAFGCTVKWDNDSSTVIITSEPEYEYYNDKTVPLYDAVINTAEPIENNGEDFALDAYVYSTTYDDVTEYLMAVQKYTDFSAYSSAFNEDMTVTHAYVNSDSTAAMYITFGEKEPYGYIAVLEFEYAEGHEPEAAPETSDDAEQTPQQDAPNDEQTDDEYYPNTDDTVPTFESITGAQLIETEEDEEYTIYKYNGGFMGEAMYSMMLSMNYGFTLYDTRFDFDSTVKYYTDGEHMVGIMSSMFGSEVWIIIPR